MGFTGMGGVTGMGMCIIAMLFAPAACEYAMQEAMHGGALPGM